MASRTALIHAPLHPRNIGRGGREGGREGGGEESEKWTKGAEVPINHINHIVHAGMRTPGRTHVTGRLAG